MSSNSSSNEGERRLRRKLVCILGLALALGGSLVVYYATLQQQTPDCIVVLPPTVIPESWTSTSSPSTPISEATTTTLIPLPPTPSTSAAPTLSVSSTPAEELTSQGELKPSESPPSDLGLSLIAKASALEYNNSIFHLKGVSWFGMETGVSAPHGLWGPASIDEYLSFVAQHDFNFIRLPFSLENIAASLGMSELGFGKQAINIDTGASAGFADAKNKQDSVEVIEEFVRKAAEHGLLVMLDLHQLTNSARDGIWFTDRVSEAAVAKMWRLLAERLCGHWNVAAADIFNEPHQGKWDGSSDALNWRRAAGVLGQAVLQGCPRLLVVVEGVAGELMNWGENLVAAETYPVEVPKEKLALSPHVYGPSVFVQDFFNDADFPQNLPAIYDEHFGFLAKDGVAPLLVGEWGGFYDSYKGTSGFGGANFDMQWQDAFRDYIKERGIGSFYWCLNPNSGDTGGLIKAFSQPIQPETAKLEMLSSLPSTLIIADNN